MVTLFHLQILRLRSLPPLPPDQHPDAAEQAEEARQEGQVELHAHHPEAGTHTDNPKPSGSRFECCYLNFKIIAIFWVCASHAISICLFDSSSSRESINNSYGFTGHNFSHSVYCDVSHHLACTSDKCCLIFPRHIRDISLHTLMQKIIHGSEGCYIIYLLHYPSTISKAAGLNSDRSS